MPSTRDIRRRIKSVKNTRQITKAMELVASSKMKKSQQSALSGRPYAALLSSMLASLAPRLDENDIAHPFLAKREIKTRGILLITTDKGLCGPPNTNPFKLITDTTQSGPPAKYVSVGRKGTQHLARARCDMIADFPVSDHVAFSEIRPIVQFMVRQYLDGVIDTIEVAHSHFKNTLVQEPTLTPVLPLASLAGALETLRSGAAGSAGAAAVAGNAPDTRELLYEPSEKTVLEALLPFYVNRVIHQYFYDSRASEHSARMVAMKTAKDNATKLLDNLTLKYNKARQSAITNEILEIAAAGFAAQS
jgi:F-type H+-transporting ATPase subunit gamma